MFYFHLFQNFRFQSGKKEEKKRKEKKRKETLSSSGSGFAEIEKLK